MEFGGGGRLGTHLSESELNRFALPWSVARLTRPVCSQLLEMLGLRSQVKPKPRNLSLPSTFIFSKSVPLPSLEKNKEINEGKTSEAEMKKGQRETERGGDSGGSAGTLGERLFLMGMLRLIS